MNNKKDILKKYDDNGLISNRAFKRLNDDIRKALEKSIADSKKKIRRLKKLVEEGYKLYSA